MSYIPAMPNTQGKIQGFVHPDFASVATTLGKQIGRQRGAAVCVYHRGEPVLDLWGGEADLTGRPWEKDTLSLSFSVTKAVTATALHILVDRGELDYEDRVSKFWPEFAQSGKSDITIRQLLCHQAGLYAIRSYIDSVERVTDWEYMIHALETAEPAHTPGDRHGYHAWTFGWLVGEVVQRITRKPLGEFVASEIAEPLGLDGFYIGAPESEHSRVASTLRPTKAIGVERLRPTGKRVERALRAMRMPFSVEAFARAHVPHNTEYYDLDHPEVLSAAIPAVNGLFTARSLARFYATLGNGGELDGVRLLSPETVVRATAVQSHGRDYVLFGTRMHWRLGYHRAFTLKGGLDTSFGHLGANGSCGFADPSLELSVGYVRNFGMRQRFPYLHTVQISDAAVRCARGR